MGYVKFNPNTNKIEGYGDSTLGVPDAEISWIHVVPFSYNPTDYSYTNSISGVFNLNDFHKIVNITEIEYNNREKQIRVAMKYLRNLLTAPQFNTITSDTAFFNSAWQYEHGYDGLQNWLSGSFPNRAYYNNIPLSGSNSGSIIQQNLLTILNNY